MWECNAALRMRAVVSRGQMYVWIQKPAFPSSVSDEYINDCSDLPLGSGRKPCSPSLSLSGDTDSDRNQNQAVTLFSPPEAQVSGTFMMKEKHSLLILTFTSLTSFTRAQISSRQIFAWFQIVCRFVHIFFIFCESKAVPCGHNSCMSLSLWAPSFPLPLHCSQISKHASEVPAQNQADHTLLEPSMLWEENQAKGQKVAVGNCGCIPVCTAGDQDPRGISLR